MEFELLGKDVLVAEIITEAGERRGIVEGERAQAARLGKIDSKMASDARTAAVTEEHDLVAGIMRRLRGMAQPIAALVKRQFF